MTQDDQIEALHKALDRLMRFGRGLIHMGAIETPKSFDVELNQAFDILQRSKTETDKRKEHKQ